MKIVLLCWRDTRHPEGGGSERYLERVGQHLANAGHQVIFRTARYPGSAAWETSTRNEEGEEHAPVHFSRGGGNLSVYPWALLALLGLRLGLWRRGFGRPDVVVDTQNGVPFFASLVAGAPTVLLTHHCHREQWSVAGPVLCRVGWLIESKISPLLHRRNRWVTVSRPSAEELFALGVPRGRVKIIRNGVDPVPGGVALPDAASAPNPAVTQGRPGEPVHLVTLSRLVPHKQIEHALDAVAQVAQSHPGVVLDIIGDGWWAGKLRDYARQLGIESHVVFHGHVSEKRKHQILARAAVHVMPSRKEGWGLAVIEAGQHAVPTVGYGSSAGLRDSIIADRTGVLVDSPEQLVAAVEGLLDDPARLRELGEAARLRAGEFSWPATGQAWLELLEREAKGRAK